MTDVERRRGKQGASPLCLGTRRTRSTAGQWVAALVGNATEPGRGSQTGGDGLYPRLCSRRHLVGGHGGSVGTRWTVEQCLGEAKGEVGLDEYEVRTFHGWFRSVTLSMVALAFLAVLRANGEENAPQKRLSSQCNHQSQKQVILFKLRSLLIFQY